MSTPKKEAACIEALGSLTTHGYGRLKIGGKEYGAHRISFMLFRGPIERGMTIDHICRNRRCINPEHLRTVTGRENTLLGVGPSAANAKKTHCKRGHEFTPENIYIQPSKANSRNCRQCRKLLRLDASGREG